MSSTVQPSATDVPESPAPQSGFEGDVVDDSVGGYVRGYVNRVRGGDLGALPAVAGIVVLAILFTVAAAEHVPDAAEHHQPARPGACRSSCWRWAWSSSCCWARSTCPPAW